MQVTDRYNVEFIHNAYRDSLMLGEAKYDKREKTAPQAENIYKVVS